MARPRRLPISCIRRNQARQASRHHITRYIPNYRIMLGPFKTPFGLRERQSIVSTKVIANQIEKPSCPFIAAVSYLFVIT
jgi:hypothetical protein